MSLSHFEHPPIRGRLTKTKRKGLGRRQVLEQEILSIADRERERFGRELHDGLCQSLAGIAALASTLAKSLAANGEPVSSATAAEVARLLRNVIGEAHDLARNLGPVVSNGDCLPGALKTLARNISGAYKISCNIAWNGRCHRLCRETEAHLLRIAQEAVHNAITHGRPQNIDISLEYGDEYGSLTIRDDGAGLPKGYRNRGGIGLHTMAYRARAIGGSVTLEQRTVSGVTVACVFPLSDFPELHEGACDVAPSG